MNTKKGIKCRFLSVFVCQCMDLAEYRTLFVLSFTTPAFDPDVAPSFGTLLATINVALSMLSEVRVQWVQHNLEQFQQRPAQIHQMCLCRLFSDGEEERASFFEHSLTSFLRGDPSSEVSDLRQSSLPPATLSII